jgi:hypothetical protein
MNNLNRLPIHKNNLNQNPIFQSTVFVCKSQQLCGFFMLKGFKLHKIEPSRDNPGRNVFIFSNSSELQNTIKEFQEWRSMAFNDVNKINSKTTSTTTINSFKESNNE